jgi:hypothetical protein
MDKKLFMLSTGSKRKVWLAAGFASGADLLLLDEPFAALDAPSIAFVKELLQDISAHPGPGGGDGGLCCACECGAGGGGRSGGLMGGRVLLRPGALFYSLC